jgi:CheY-like chemotaxis protein
MSDTLHPYGADQPENRPGRAQRADPAKSRVLILDDQRDSRLVCRAYCDLFDHPSQSVASLDEALTALRRGWFDVVVMSVHMARWGGIAAMRAIRALPAPAGALPLIGLAELGRADEAQRWRAAGFAAVVGKPVSAARFHAALRIAREDETGARRSWAPTE